MKKIILLLVLGLLLQSAPTKALASGPPPASVGVVGLVVLGLIALDSKPSAKAAGTEFEILNNNPAFNTLMTQMAGGSLNTLEILK